MNVLYILGNGFDKAQGMNTSYPEFYAYLQSISSPKDSRLLSILKQDIKSNIVFRSPKQPKPTRNNQT